MALRTWLMGLGVAACAQEVADNAIVLSHWGRMDEHPTSSSRYMADIWSANWNSDTRAPAGKRWRFPRGSRAMIGEHRCYSPSKDIVVPVFSPPSYWSETPWLDDCAAGAVDLRLLLRQPRPARAAQVRVASAIDCAVVQRHGRLEALRQPGRRVQPRPRALEFCIVPPGRRLVLSRRRCCPRLHRVIMDRVHAVRDRPRLCVVRRADQRDGRRAGGRHPARDHARCEDAHARRDEPHLAALHVHAGLLGCAVPRRLPHDYLLEPLPRSNGR